MLLKRTDDEMKQVLKMGRAGHLSVRGRRGRRCHCRSRQEEVHWH